MSILVYIENQESTIKKTSLEAAAMAASLAKDMGTSVFAVSVGGNKDDLAKLGAVGISEVINLSIENGNIAQVVACAVEDIAKAHDAKIIISSHSTLTEGMVSRIAIKLNGTAVTNVIGKPIISNGFVVRKSVFTSKAFVHLNIKSEVKVMTLKKGSFDAVDGTGDVEIKDINMAPNTLGEYVISETKKQEGDILLPEADLVVSAGRGLKGPENWGMIEELAQTLGAATACSKPVSDTDWRPHHEHVGQTGIKISPNLYIAVGISGAIQHLAGVSSSKVIVVINTDEDAPFFKAADYGIVGDAFEVIPRLITALKE